MVKQLRAHGEFPAGPVYKAFTNIAHSEEFISHGRFRMGSLSSYRQIEDPTRRDAREGEGHIQIPGLVTVAHFATNDQDFFEETTERGLQQHHMELGNPIYIFSTCLEGVDLDLIGTRWPFIVRIDNPERFAADISAYLMTLDEKWNGGIEGCAVSYNHGEIAEEPITGIQRLTLSYSQKPRGFENEMEFRFVAINTETPSKRVYADFIEIDLGGPITYASAL